MPQPDTDQLQRVRAFPAGATLIFTLAVLLALAGLLLSSQANLGPSLVAAGCLFGIWARILQAAVHYRHPPH